MDGPVVLKILSPDLLHKSDVGGVRLGLKNPEAVREAAQEMLESLARSHPRARLQGFSVQAQVTRPLAQELIVGAHVDPIFGPVLLFGHGGVAVEVLADRAVALPPLNRALARDLIERTRVRRLLAGFRGRAPADLDAIADVLIAVARLLADLPELAELDINPLWADAQGALALDGRIRLSPAKPAGVAHFAIRPYPDEWESRVAWQGQTLLLRPIRPEDEAAHQAFLDAVTADDLWLRFFQAPHRLSHDELARLTQIDYEREMAFIAVDAAQQTLGVARLVRDPDNTEAEFAVLVRSDLQGRGLGRLLMQRLLDCATARGTQRIVGDVLRENHGMLSLAKALGFEMSADAHDPARVGDGYEDAYDSIEAAGGHAVSFFLERTRREVPLAEARESLRR